VFEKRLSSESKKPCRYRENTKERIIESRRDRQSKRQREKGQRERKNENGNSEK